MIFIAIIFALVFGLGAAAAFKAGDRLMGSMLVFACCTLVPWALFIGWAS